MDIELKERIKAALPIITKPAGYSVSGFIDELKSMKRELKHGSLYLCRTTKEDIIKVSINTSINHYSTLGEFLDVVLDEDIDEDDIKTHVKMRMWWIKKNIKFYKTLV